MTRLFAVPPDKVPQVWPLIREGAKRGAEKAGNGGFEELERDTLDGLTVVWLALDGDKIEAFAITDLLWDGTKKVCVVMSCGGRDRKRWIHHLREIEDWARGEHCEAMRVYGRKGWHRVLADYSPIDGGLEKSL